MNKKYKVITGIIIGLGLVLLVVVLLRGHTVAVLSPQGQVAEKQRHLIALAAGLAIFVVVPVYALLIGIAWKYHEKNTSAKYTPDWDRNIKAETIWWVLPSLLILFLSVVTWNSSHGLDPFKALVSSKKPITVQVVALQYKWLFIYPEQNIATVNMLHFPEKTPVHFEITADAPMNSFWIPQLGGQIYAMSGMMTELNLEAAHTGTYRGSSANLSGKGFAKMNFTAKSDTQAEFDKWVVTVKESPNQLVQSRYDRLAKPGGSGSLAYYSGYEPDLFNGVLNKYMPYEHHHVTAQKSQEAAL
jgi:cytochrome o ubiquinol oxidase subunit 2